MSTKLLFSLAITAILTLTGCGGDGGGSDSGSNSSGGSENNLNLGGEANANITFDTIIKDSAGKFVSFETDTENLTTVATETTTPNKNDNTFIAARSYFDKSLNADAGGFGNEIIERLPPDILIGNQWKEVESVAYELSQDNKTINMFYKGTNLKELQATIKLTAYDLKGDADIDIKDNNTRKFALSFTPEDKAIRYAMQVSKEGVIANLGEETDISIDNFISKRRLGSSGKLSESLQFDTSNKTIVNVDDGNKVIGTYTATSSSASSPAMLTFKFNNAELKTMHGLGNKDDIEVLFVELGGKVYQAGKKHPANYNANAYNEVVKNRLEAMLKNEFYAIAAQGQLKIKNKERIILSLMESNT